MELQTIGQVSRDYGVSPRMLRYYEQVGLIRSRRRAGYAYRVYDQNNLARLRQIIVLRKLRVPVKQIAAIVNNSDAAETVEIFRWNINQLDAEIDALATVKSILTRFVEEISEKTDIKLKLLDNEAAFLSALSFSDNRIAKSDRKMKEGKTSMEDLSQANQRLDRYEDKDVRIVYLPPMTVAAAFASGENCEGKTGGLIIEFARNSGLLSIKPDARSFGFDCSQEATGIGEPSHVYEMWVSVPDEMEIPAPLIRREFGGGMYAAHVLTDWNFDDWRLLGEWVKASDKYDNDWGAPRWRSAETVFGQGLEETLNFHGLVRNDGSMENMQLDLLFPVRKKAGDL